MVRQRSVNDKIVEFLVHSFDGRNVCFRGHSGNSSRTRVCPLSDHSGQRSILAWDGLSAYARSGHALCSATYRLLTQRTWATKSRGPHLTTARCTPLLSVWRFVGVIMGVLKQSLAAVIAWLAMAGPILCALSVATPAAASSVANGSFEQGTFTGPVGGSQDVSPGDTALSNWTVSGAPVTWYESGDNLNQIALTPHTGNFGINLAADDGSVRFSESDDQSFAVFRISARLLGWKLQRQ